MNLQILFLKGIGRIKINYMPKIQIETCEKTPNLCALEAVTSHIKTNYEQRGKSKYKFESTIVVSSGRVVIVEEEVPNRNSESMCNSRFIVKTSDV